MLGCPVSESGTTIGDYVLECRIGEGAYGTVYVARHTRSNERYAVKVMLLDSIRSQGLEQSVRREATVLQGLRHPHVVSLVKVLQSTQAYYFIMELAEGGELFDRIIQSKCFKESVARKYFQQLVSAIHFCHSQNVAHRDLKAENLLLDAHGDLKVCDFGLCSKRLPIEDESQSSPLEQRGNASFLQAGTVSYMTPESLRGNDYDEYLADIWSAGVILYFMITGTLPFDSASEEETIHNIIHHRIDFSRVAQKELREFLEKILADDPIDRYTLEQIMQDEWFLTDIDVTLFPKMLLPLTMSRSNSRSFLDFSVRPRGGSLKIDDVTEEEIGAIQRVFNSIDTDGYGDRITRDELRDAMITLRKGKVDSETLDKLLNILGFEGRDSITFEQFRDAWIENDLAKTYFKDADVTLLATISNTIHDSVEKEVIRQLRKSFDAIDETHCGVISRDQWKKIFGNAQIDVSDDDIAGLIQYIRTITGDNGEVSFDDFALGIVKRDMLVKHPMGKKLAKAANLTSFAMARQIREFLTTGFTVVGLRDVILEKIANYDPSVLKRNPCNCAPSVTSNNSVSIPFTWEKDRLAATGDTFDSPSLSPQRTFNEDDLLRTQNSLSNRSMSMVGGNAPCAFDVVIIPTSCVGYSVIKINRISGSTADFHEAVHAVYEALETEREQALYDLSPVGESELM